MSPDDLDTLDWDKGQGLLPLIVQDYGAGTVLMTGFVNREALALMIERRQVVLYSRSRKRLWIKGESSGNYIRVQKLIPDCDRDALLVLGTPCGPSCHTGKASCFPNGEPLVERLAFVKDLQGIIAARLSSPTNESYTARLVAQGIQRVAQKVGEEALEVALSAVASGDRLESETADLLFHLLVLLSLRGVELEAVVDILRRRHLERTRAPHRTAGTARQPSLTGKRGIRDRQPRTHRKG
jgi:phosphoribosyl-ATP pyrophosphohydrolase/phosphoribosyl-AMP cyclohydrolase